MLALALLLASGATTSASAQPQGPQEMLRRLGETYARLPSYRDYGELIVILPAQPPQTWYFQTAYVPGTTRRQGKLVWRLSEKQGAAWVLWSDGGSVHLFHAASQSHASVGSVAEGLARILGVDGALAAPVPGLLLGEAPLESLEGAHLEGTETCGDVRCQVVAGGLQGVRLRLWVEGGTSLLHRTEAELPSLSAEEPAATRELALLHRLEAHAVPPTPDKIRFRPPSLSREVEEISALPISRPRTRGSVLAAYEAAEGSAEAPAETLGSPAQAPLAVQAGEALPVFGEVISVGLITSRLRVSNRRGDPVEALTPADLRVRIGGREVPVAGLDWVSYRGRAEPRNEVAPTPEARARRLAEERIEPLTLPPERGRLFVLFTQIGTRDVVTLDASWVQGHMRLLPSLERMVEGLEPEDWVAIVSFDSHLKLWQDFSRDRSNMREKIFKTIGFGEPRKLDRHRPRGAPSLTEHLDLREADRASSPEEALLLLARALEPLPGSKEVIYAGWAAQSGVATYSRAVRALQQASATVSVLDVVQADSHLLATGLRHMAASTGGSYQATFDDPRKAVETLARSFTGEYIVSLDRDRIPPEGGDLEIQVRGRPDLHLHYLPLTFPGR